MQSKQDTNFLGIFEILILAALLVVLNGCQTQNGGSRPEHATSRMEISLSDVQEYLSSSSLSSRVTEELFAESYESSVLCSRTPEELALDVESVADARARVLSDISYYPMRSGLLEVAGGMLAQELLLLKITYYNAIPGEAESVQELALRLRKIRCKHPELPGGAAEKILQELDCLAKDGAISSGETK